ncbi:MAG: nuclear transport factor 2 family protein [Pseudonocardia sp.]
MAQVDDFLTETLPRQHAAIRAMCDGDAEPWIAMWSTADPLSTFGAVRTATGRDAVARLAGAVAARYSGVTDVDFELVAAGASGELAYTVGLETKTAVFDGAPATGTLRVTHVYRREGGEWRVVHRHGDRPPPE